VVSHSKGVPTTTQTDFAIISRSAHPSGDTGNKTSFSQHRDAAKEITLDSLLE